MLDAADAVGDLREVPDAELLLVLHAERAVVGRDDLRLVGPQRPPQLVLVPLLAGPQRRRAHPLGALEPRCAELFLEREVQVLRAGLPEDVEAAERAAAICAMACFAETCTTYSGAPVRSASMIARWVASSSICHGRETPWKYGEVSPRARCCATRASMAGPFSACIMIVRAVVAGALHGEQDLVVGRVEDARVGHEQLEAGDALADELVHGLEGVLVDPAEDLVEPVVDRAVPGGLLVPRGEAVLDPLAEPLDGEVDDRRGAAPRGGRGARLERVGGERAAERQLHVGVHVDPAGDDVLAGRVDDALRGRGQVVAEQRSSRARRGRRSSRRR